LRPTAIKEASEWMDPYRRAWNESFDQLDALLKEMQQRRRKENRNGRKK
jgi:hypothetical protein